MVRERDGPARFLFGEAKDHLAAVVGAIAEMESKTGAIIRFNALIIGLLVTGFSFLFRADADAVRLSPWTVGLFILGFLALVASTLMAVRAYLKREVAVGADPERFMDALEAGADMESLLTESIRAYQESIGENRLVIELSARRLKWSLYALMASLLLLSLAATALLTLRFH